MEIKIRGKCCLIDDDDIWILRYYKSFSRSETNHVQCSLATKPVDNNPRFYLHRLIMRALPHEEIDHINRDPLDNRKCNLRKVTRQQNLYNSCKHSNKFTSRFKGVHKTRSKTNPWEATIFIGRKRLRLGVFKTENDAAIAYNDAAKKYRPDYSFLNIISDDCLSSPLID